MTTWTVERRAAHKEACRLKWADPEWAANQRQNQRNTWDKARADPAEMARRSDIARQTAIKTHARGAIPYGTDAQRAGSRAQWEDPNYRARMIAASSARYAAGIGIASKDAVARSAQTRSKIMKQALSAMMTETDFVALHSATALRIREEMPFDGGDYYEYQSMLYKAVASDPAIRELVDAYLSKKLTSIYAERRRIKAELRRKKWPMTYI